MKNIFKIIAPISIFLIVFAFAGSVQAATRTWRGTVDANWGTAGNWLEGAVPLNTDDVVFDATSTDCTVDTSARVANAIDFTNYTNTITMTNQLRVYGNITLGAGMHISGTGALVAYATGSYLSNGFVWPNLFLTGTLAGITTTFTDASAVGSLSLATNGNITLQANLTVLGDFSFGNTGSVEQINGAFNVYVGGNLTQATSGSLAGTATIVMNGTGTWSNSSTGGLSNNLTFNTAGTITVSGVVRYNTGTLTYTAGTMITTGSTLIIQVATTINTSGMTWNNITVGSITVTLASNLTASGNVYLGGSVGTCTLNGYTMYVGGNLTDSTGGGGGNTTGTTSIVLNGIGTWSSAGINGIANNIEINTAGTITIGTVYLYTNSQTVKYTAGTLNTTNALVYLRSFITTAIMLDLNGMTLKELHIGTSSYAPVVSLASGFSIAGSFTNSNSASHMTIKSNSAGTQRKLTLLPGATHDLRLLNATDIDSSDGLKIYSWGGALSNTLNWAVLSAPKTVSSTF